MKKKEKKYRIDSLLISKGYAENKEEVKRLILGRKVRIGSDCVVEKTTETFPESADLNVDTQCRYVSRGAFKLLPAIKKYTPDLKGEIGLDVGSSTGGFTEVMLELGAQKVYAVDSGTNQLHYKLRTDSRVVSMEKTNAKNLTVKDIPEGIDVFTMDVSFISVRVIIPSLLKLFSNNSFGYILVKPQFELPRELVEEGGVIRTAGLRQKAIDDVKTFIADNTSWKVLEVISSPIKGPKGNQEYILCIKINN